ncbi:unnamed protein product [Adineta steineri]|uniref:Peptide-methionine (R)-S-oxide reductase n=1 Tax=Adineta steineri TaxID=433720 RepID=A0A815GVV2_9BILA|nr:unnamed protein product [Adineta steineri]CAF1123263.1 unnamed protein product [Adineta steineri]CAF1263782.1 unnamed protein product [Adineta steineri]CAF1345712.1 unnamed protein product [Adineta steineri]CAF1552140.1 unnamed protein product [Adineta steineri]
MLRSINSLSRRSGLLLYNSKLNIFSSSDNKQQQKLPAVNLTDAEWKKKLTNEQYRILRQKDTEYPGTGEYNKHFQTGIYKCAGCEQELYDSSSKFDSHCGWPAFSSSIGTAVRRQMDTDGHRNEILCAKCDGHLGHVFEGEGLRDANGKIVQQRHCVNSASLKFEKQK